MESLPYAIWLIVIGLFLNIFLPKYIGKKAENLATKEDIGEITRAVEDIKHDNAQKLEKVRSDLSSQLSRNGFRYEKEFEILEELNKLSVEVINAALSLRPVFDSVDPQQSAEDRKIQRLQILNDAGYKLYKFKQDKRPFFTAEIYDLLKDLQDLTHLESSQYKILDPMKTGQQYWNDAQKNSEDIIKATENIIDAIRNRVVEWDK